MARRETWLAGSAYTVAYVALDALSFVEPLLKLGITPWNPHAGLALAFLVWRGWRQIVWVAGAALAAELLVRGTSAPLPVLCLAAASVAAGYGLLAAALARPGRGFTVANHRDALRLVCGSALTALVVAVAYCTLFVRAGALPADELFHAVARYWVGDLNGVLTLTPLLLALHRFAAPPRLPRGRPALAAVQAVLLAAVVWFVFGADVREAPQFVYLLVVPVVWLALTWGVAGATLGTLLIQLGLLVGARGGVAADAVVELQFLLLTLSVTALLLGAGVLQRLRDFYSNGASTVGEVDLAAVVGKVLDSFAERAASRRIELQHELAGAGTVRADPIQLQMVLHNLVTNEFEALEMRNRAGWIRIAFDGGERPTLRVIDSGPGPALSRSLMRGQGGDLRLLSSGVGGTCFVVEMPPAAGARIAA